MTYEQKRQFLIDFFMFFRDKGEAYIGISIDQFVDKFLKEKRFKMKKLEITDWNKADKNGTIHVLRFQHKKITENVKGILGLYLDGTEEEFRQATEKIVEIIKGEHIAKEHFRKQRDNNLIKLQDIKDAGF